ncbi:MAG: YybH family protein [Acidobacteriaceae bacterium]
MQSRALLLSLLLALCGALPVSAQLDPFAHTLPPPGSLSDPSATPGRQLLFSLEAKYAAAVKSGGGPAFASFFADDGVTLANGKAPVIGRTAIAAEGTWKPEQYQLTWTPEGGSMGPSGSEGYTWGHYDGRARDAHGNPVITQGRYITLWKKGADGTWKIALEASNEQPATECCKLP